MEVPSQKRLKHVCVAGYRSLRNVELVLDPVTVLIGPNGAGKSNLFSALELVQHLARRLLQRFVASRGGASFLLHYGPKHTESIDIKLALEGLGGEFKYEIQLGYGADESLVFLSEMTAFRTPDSPSWQWEDLGTGHREAHVTEDNRDKGMCGIISALLRELTLYHFHDTSRRSALRTRYVNQASHIYLRPDGGNLPAFLLALRDSRNDSERAAWKRIGELVRRVAPFISELVPERDGQGAILDWIDDRGETLGPSHLSDGTLRAIALLTAMGQPIVRMPMLSCIDEPELGLHPAALDLFCSLVSSVGEHRQVILSTQSPALLDNFEPSSVVVAERVDSATSFRRLDESALSAWLEEYSLSEIYDKNLIGGRP